MGIKNKDKSANDPKTGQKIEQKPFMIGTVGPFIPGSQPKTQSVLQAFLSTVQVLDPTGDARAYANLMFGDPSWVSKTLDKVSGKAASVIREQKMVDARGLLDKYNADHKSAIEDLTSIEDKLKAMQADRDAKLDTLKTDAVSAMQAAGSYDKMFDVAWIPGQGIYIPGLKAKKTGTGTRGSNLPYAFLSKPSYTRKNVSWLADGKKFNWITLKHGNGATADGDGDNDKAWTCDLVMTDDNKKFSASSKSANDALVSVIEQMRDHYGLVFTKDDGSPDTDRRVTFSVGKQFKIPVEDPNAGTDDNADGDADNA